MQNQTHVKIYQIHNKGYENTYQNSTHKPQGG